MLVQIYLAALHAMSGYDNYVESDIEQLISEYLALGGRWSLTLKVLRLAYYK